MKITRSKIILGIILVVLIWFLSGVIINKNYENAGEIGDMFGAINALFSGLALFGILVSLFIQHEELKNQWEEIKNSQKEFRLNRITNILFKQIHATNQEINNLKFKIVRTSRSVLIDINEYVYNNEPVMTYNTEDEVESPNDKTIRNLLVIIANYQNAFNEILLSSELTNQEQLQLQRLFYNNLDTNAKKIIEMVIRNLNTEIKQINREDIKQLKPHLMNFKKLIEIAENIRDFGLKK